MRGGRCQPSYGRNPIRSALLEGQADLGNELGGVLVLGRPLQVGVAQDAQGRQALFLCVVQEPPPHSGQVFVGAVVENADSGHGGQQLHVLVSVP